MAEQTVFAALIEQAIFHVWEKKFIEGVQELERIFDKSQLPFTREQGLLVQRISSKYLALFAQRNMFKVL